MKSDRAPEELVDLSRASLFLSVANAYLSVCRTAAFGKAGLPSPSVVDLREASGRLDTRTMQI